jgi:hypothetical protein
MDQSPLEMMIQLKLLAPKMNPSPWLHFVVDSMAIGSFLKLVLSFSSCKT